MQFKIKISLLNKYILNFPGIAEAGVNNVKWRIVEFYEYNKNIVDGIKESYIYLTKNGLAEGIIKINLFLLLN